MHDRLDLRNEESSAARTDHDATRALQSSEAAQIASLTFFEDIRSSGLNATIREDSAVARVNETLRVAHVLSILPSLVLKAVGVSVEMGSFLALKHFNERSGEVLPFVPERLKDCDLRFTMSMFDSEAQPLPSVRKLLDSLPASPSFQNPYPMALIGAGYSIPSESLAIIGGVRDIPQCSCCATSRDLDGKSEHPLFTRTTPTGREEAQAAAQYFSHLGVSHSVVLHVGDLYAQLIARDFQAAADALGDATPVTIEYKGGDVASMKRAIERIKESELKYTYAIMFIPDAVTFCELAYDAGIMGRNGHVWIWAQGASPFSNLHSTVIPEKALKAMHGVGATILHTPENSRYNAALDSFKADQALQEYYVSKQGNPDFFTDFDFSSVMALHFSLYNYDAAMAVGIAACEAENEFFTPSELYESIIRTEFQGVTGPVAFNNATGTRNAEGVRFKVQNVLATQGPDGKANITTVVSAFIDYDAPNVVEIVKPFVYADNTTNQPPSLPPHLVDPNLIGTGARATGLSLAGLIMVLSIAWGAWTAVNRKQRKVRASQPFFLFMICIGTFIIGSSIIPTSFQEPMSERTLDFGCMCFPWLFCIGFVTAFSALFTKNGRINTIYQSAKAFRRVKIRPVDALVPFAILMVLNTSLLIAWTVTAPLQWKRVYGGGVDRFERPTDSYGVCASSNHSLALAFVIPLAVVNVVPVLFANYISYKARSLPSEFNESKQVALSMASLMEAFLIGLPIIIMTRSDPTAFFLSRAVIIFVVSLVIILFMFVPKWMNKNLKEKPTRKLSSTAPASSVAESSIFSSLKFRKHGNSSRAERSITLGRDSAAADTSSSRFGNGDEEKGPE